MPLPPIYLGSDHAGFQLKKDVQKYVKDKGYRVVDLGVFQIEPPADYPDIAREVGEKVRENGGAIGILFCGTGIGMCMAANKMKGIRAVNCESTDYAKMAREHNDANILCLGGRHIALDKAKEIVDAFLAAKFAGDERHVRRVAKMDK